MKTSSLATLAAFLATTSAVPFTWDGLKHGIPTNGWRSSKYDSPVEGWENMTLGAPHGGWSTVKYSAPVGGWGAIVYPNTEKQNFTSYYHVLATGAQVKNGSESNPGPENAVGYYSMSVNSGENKICYKITLQNATGNYTTPLYQNKTSTYLRYGPRNSTGPVVLAFPNPVSNTTNPYDSKLRTSEGCMKGPFNTTTGEVFDVKKLEEHPGDYYVDVKTENFPGGVVRGQVGGGKWHGNAWDYKYEGKIWNGKTWVEKLGDGKTWNGKAWVSQ